MISSQYVEGLGLRIRELEQQLTAKVALLRKNREDWAKINDKIYEVGAPHGGWNYWMIRETACNNIKVIDDELK
jgi:hypothetical protein